MSASHARPRARRLPRFGLLLAGALAALASGCGPTMIVVLWPPDTSTVTFMPLEIELAFAPTANVQSLQVVLNGSDVSSLFVVDETPIYTTRARAYAVGAPELLPGANLLVASIAMPGGALHTTMASFTTTSGDPYVDSVPAHSIGPQGGFNAGLLPGIVTGPPVGGGLFGGGLDVVSLGSAGWIELAFDDNAIVDGPGTDFLVFENAFLGIGGQFITAPPFAEPGRVSVSQDGIQWFEFPCVLVEQSQPLAPPYYPGCAGVWPTLSVQESPHPSEESTVALEDLVGQNALTLVVPEGAGGDAFDLADVGLEWARYLRIEGADFVSEPTGTDNFGFDLDAAVAIHSIPADDLDMDGVPDALLP